jgi:hypothetical protein
MAALPFTWTLTITELADTQSNDCTASGPLPACTSPSCYCPACLQVPPPSSDKMSAIATADPPDRLGPLAGVSPPPTHHTHKKAHASSGGLSEGLRWAPGGDMAGLLEDLVALGDGGWWLDRVLSPIFWVMSYEVRRTTRRVMYSQHCFDLQPSHQRGWKGVLCTYVHIYMHACAGPTHQATSPSARPDVCLPVLPHIHPQMDHLYTAGVEVAFR